MFISGLQPEPRPGNAPVREIPSRDWLLVIYAFRPSAEASVTTWFRSRAFQLFRSAALAGLALVSRGRHPFAA